MGLCRYMLLLVLVNDSICKQGLLTGKGECYSSGSNITRYEIDPWGQSLGTKVERKNVHFAICPTFFAAFWGKKVLLLVECPLFAQL